MPTVTSGIRAVDSWTASVSIADGSRLNGLEIIDKEREKLECRVTEMRIMVNSMLENLSPSRGNGTRIAAIYEPTNELEVRYSTDPNFPSYVHVASPFNPNLFYSNIQNSHNSHINSAAQIPNVQSYGQNTQYAQPYFPFTYQFTNPYMYYTPPHTQIPVQTVDSHASMNPSMMWNGGAGCGPSSESIDINNSVWNISGGSERQLLVAESSASYVGENEIEDSVELLKFHSSVGFNEEDEMNVDADNGKLISEVDETKMSVGVNYFPLGAKRQILLELPKDRNELEMSASAFLERTIQTNTFEEYFEEFQVIRAQLEAIALHMCEQLTESFFLEYFIAGLEEESQSYVKRLAPSTVYWASVYVKKGHLAKRKQIAVRHTNRSIDSPGAEMEGLIDSVEKIDGNECHGVNELSDQNENTKIADITGVVVAKEFEEIDTSGDKTEEKWTDVVYVFRNGLPSAYVQNERVEDTYRLFESSSSLEIVSWDCLMGRYVKKMRLRDASHQFDKMQVRDVLGESVISGYVQNGDWFMGKKKVKMKGKGSRKGIDNSMAVCNGFRQGLKFIFDVNRLRMEVEITLKCLEIMVFHRTPNQKFDTYARLSRLLDLFDAQEIEKASRLVLTAGETQPYLVFRLLAIHGLLSFMGLMSIGDSVRSERMNLCFYSTIFDLPALKLLKLDLLAYCPILLDRLPDVNDVVDSHEDYSGVFMVKLIEDDIVSVVGFKSLPSWSMGGLLKILATFLMILVEKYGPDTRWKSWSCGNESDALSLCRTIITHHRSSRLFLGLYGLLAFSCIYYPHLEVRDNDMIYLRMLIYVLGKRHRCLLDKEEHLNGNSSFSHAMLILFSSATYGAVPSYLILFLPDKPSKSYSSFYQTDSLHIITLEIDCGGEECFKAFVLVELEPGEPIPGPINMPIEIKDALVYYVDLLCGRHVAVLPTLWVTFHLKGGKGVAAIIESRSLMEQCKSFGVHIEEPLTVHTTDMGQLCDVEDASGWLGEVIQQTNHEKQDQLNLIVGVMARKNTWGHLYQDNAMKLQSIGLTPLQGMLLKRSQSLYFIQVGILNCEYAEILLTREQAQVFIINGDTLVLLQPAGIRERRMMIRKIIGKGLFAFPFDRGKLSLWPK